MSKTTPSKNDIRSRDMNARDVRGAANLAARVQAGHITVDEAAAKLAPAAAAGSPAAAQALAQVVATDTPKE